MIQATIIFEFCLAILAVVLAHLLGLSWQDQLPGWSEASFGAAWTWGVISALPLLGVFLLLDRVPVAALREIRDWLQQMLTEHFAEATVSSFLWIAIAAGVGEELLFRGVCQRWLATIQGFQIGPDGRYAPVLAILTTSLLFGFAHMLSWTYFWLAFAASVYFGVVHVLSDNLWSPILAHASYDFVALVYLRYWSDGAPMQINSS